MKRSLAAALAFSFMLVSGARSEAADISVIAANAVRGALLELGAAFEKSSSHKVATQWGGTTAIAKRIESGDVFDIVLIGSEQIDALIAKGKLAAGSRADFAKSGIGIAITSGVRKPDVSTREALKNAVLAAKSVAYSSGPSGYYIAELFRKMGIADQIKDKVKQPPSGVQVGEMLARGDAELGFQQISELMHRKGIHYLGPLPPDIQNVTIYSAGLHVAARDAEVAKSLIKFLTSSGSESALQKIWMDPAGR